MESIAAQVLSAARFTAANGIRWSFGCRISIYRHPDDQASNLDRVAGWTGRDRDWPDQSHVAGDAVSSEAATAQTE